MLMVIYDSDRCPRHSIYMPGILIKLKCPNPHGSMYGESNVEIYNTICKIDSQWEFAV